MTTNRNRRIYEIKEAHKDEPLEDWYTLIEEAQKECPPTEVDQEA